MSVTLKSYGWYYGLENVGVTRYVTTVCTKTNQLRNEILTKVKHHTFFYDFCIDFIECSLKILRFVLWFGTFCCNYRYATAVCTIGKREFSENLTSHLKGLLYSYRLYYVFLGRLSIVSCCDSTFWRNPKCELHQFGRDI